MAETEKGAGRGKGRFTERGVQAQQSADIEALKALVNEMAGRLDALEAAGVDVDNPGEPTDGNPDDEPHVEHR
jgi:copper homeostasis protein CutC